VTFINAKGTPFGHKRMTFGNAKCAVFGHERVTFINAKATVLDTKRMTFMQMQMVQFLDVYKMTFISAYQGTVFGHKR
jgi:hypothetical protein